VKLVRQDAIHVLWGDLPMSQCRNLATIARRVLIKTRQGKHLVCPVFLERTRIKLDLPCAKDAKKDNINPSLAMPRV
jgi:hypothetical protein